MRWLELYSSDLKADGELYSLNLTWNDWELYSHNLEWGDQKLYLPDLIATKNSIHLIWKPTKNFIRPIWLGTIENFIQPTWKYV